MTKKKIVHKSTAKAKGKEKEKPRPTIKAKGKAKAKSRVKATRTVKRPNKRSDSRCTPMKFRNIYDELSPDKKRLIDEMSLGAFRHLPKDYINYKILSPYVQVTAKELNKLK